MVRNYKRGSGNYKSSYLEIYVKQVDEIVNNSSTMQDDNELVATLRVGKSYGIDLCLFVLSNSTADIKYQCSIPTGATSIRTDGTFSPVIAIAVQDFTTTQKVSLGSTVACIRVSGRIVMGSTAGNFNLQWAQEVATVVDTKVLSGSWLEVMEG